MVFVYLSSLDLILYSITTSHNTIMLLPYLLYYSITLTYSIMLLPYLYRYSFYR